MMTVIVGGGHPEERYPLNKAARRNAATLDAAIARVAENWATAANMEEALARLAKACGIPVGVPGWLQYHSTASRQGDKVVIEIEPVAD